MRRGLPRWAARALLTVALGLGFLGLWLPAPASAVDPEAWVEVRIDTMSPALPSRDGTIRLTGTVKNTSTITLDRLQAVLWRSRDPIEDAEGMARALVSAANEPLGSRVRPASIFENIPSDADRSLAPGRSTDFDLTADVADFELPDEDAVYLIGVQIRGQVQPGGNDQILGRGRIFLPLVDEADREDGPEQDDESNRAPDVAPLPLTSVVVLASRPSLVRPGVLSDEHLSREISPGGRLDVLLRAARQPTVSFAVDPAMIEELETMRRDYFVLDELGEATPGTGQAAATRWLADFARLLGSGDGFRLLYGTPDLTALVHDAQTGIIEQARTAGDQVATTRSLPLLVLPTGGRADEATVAVADNLDPRAILLSENSARAPEGQGAVLAGPGAAPIVRYQATAFGGGPGPAPERTPVKIRQRALADNWLTVSAAGEDGPAPEVRLITSPSQASTVSAERVPWIKPVTLSKLLADTPAEWDRSFAYGSKAGDAELSPLQLGELRGLSEGFTTYTDLMVEAAKPAEQARSALPRVASGSWRNAQRAFATYTDAVRSTLDSVLRDEVSISVPARVLTTGRDARFPITVYNKLPADPTDPQANAIRVVVRFRSANSQRLTVAPVELRPPLLADTNRTENVQVRAETNGSVQVTAELFTRSGRPLGKPVPVLVNATQAGTTGWIIALVAGVVLVGTTALRIRQVARERSGQADTEPMVVSHPAPEAMGSGMGSGMDSVMGSGLGSAPSESAPAEPLHDRIPDRVREPGKDRDPLDV